MTILVELCAGSAALTRHLLGAGGKIVGYPGVKDDYVEALLEYLDVTGVDDYLLVDPGFWGQIWPVLVLPGECERAARQLRQWDAEYAATPRDLWVRVRTGENTPAAVLARLFLTLNGDEVANYAGYKSASPGLARLADRVGAMEGKLCAVKVLRQRAEDVEPRGGCVVYLDPPRRPGCLHDLFRPAVVETALAWRAAGSSVYVSEADIVDELAEEGWEWTPLYGKRDKRRRHVLSAAEYLTFSRVSW